MRSPLLTAHPSLGPESILPKNPEIAPHEFDTMNEESTIKGCSSNGVTVSHRIPRLSHSAIERRRFSWVSENPTSVMKIASGAVVERPFS